jgi:hypothetical protein
LQAPLTTAISWHKAAKPQPVSQGCTPWFLHLALSWSAPKGPSEGVVPYPIDLAGDRDSP